MKLATLTSPAFQAALETLCKLTLPVKTAFKLKGLKKLVVGECGKFDEMKADLIARYAEHDEEGQVKLVEGTSNVLFKPEHVAAANKEFGELLLLEVELGKLHIEELGNVSVDPNTLFALDGLVSDQDPATPG